MHADPRQMEGKLLQFREETHAHCVVGGAYNPWRLQLSFHAASQGRGFSGRLRASNLAPGGRMCCPPPLGIASRPQTFQNRGGGIQWTPRRASRC
jgi:hypothetical protein